MKSLYSVQQTYFRDVHLLRTELLFKRLELRDFLTNPNIKAETIQTKYWETSELQSRLEEKSIEYLIRVKNLLTQEQLKHWCPEQEFPPFRRMMHEPGPMGSMSPKRNLPSQERARED